MRTRGHRGGTVPGGSGQEQCGDPECHPANPAPAPGHKPLGVRGWPAPQQPLRCPAKKIRPDRCGTGHPNPGVPPTHPSHPIKRFLTEELWRGVPRAASLGRGAVWDRISMRVGYGPGAGDTFPRGRNLGHAVLGARPAGRWAVPEGAGEGRTPPIDLRTNANGVAGVTPPSPGEPLWILGATNGVRASMARRTLQRTPRRPSGREVGRELPGGSKVETSR
jgi:hypothetical protein